MAHTWQGRTFFLWHSLIVPTALHYAFGKEIQIYACDKQVKRIFTLIITSET
jgi:hypothetical protein